MLILLDPAATAEYYQDGSKSSRPTQSTVPEWGTPRPICHAMSGEVLGKSLLPPPPAALHVVEPSSIGWGSVLPFGLRMHACFLLTASQPRRGSLFLYTGQASGIASRLPTTVARL